MSMKVIIKQFGQIEPKDVKADIYVEDDYIIMEVDEYKYEIPREVFTGIGL